MTLEETIAERRADILALAARRGARNVRIFGSVARGASGPGSDIDFLVDLEPGRDIFDLGGLLMDLRDLLGCDVDVLTEKEVSRYIRQQVLEEAVAV